MNLTLMVWRQKGPKETGKMVKIPAKGITPEMSFLEMLDVVNEDLIQQGLDPIAFDSDCREGICGACGIVINGQAHGPKQGTTTCQLHMREFKEGDTIILEPWRSRAFGVIKDLVVEKDAFDRIIAAGGYVSVRTGTHADANTILISKKISDQAMDAATCIGCGACVAACPNASASLFTAAKISHLALLPQGHPERTERVTRMINQMDKEGFGNCTNLGECQAACPKEISIDHIARMKREYVRALCERSRGDESQNASSGPG